ncbi:MAG: septum formation initiator family protein [Lachnospiraceae bacterium]|nr:septum formation initiator family protein [Lachnospiraceae bacterium]
MKKTVAFRKEKKNKSMLMITMLVMAALCAVVYVGGRPKVLERERLQAEIAVLQTQLADEQARTDELRELEIYTQTKKYAEEVAKEVLGYVYDGEVIFRLDD